nr:hypothetical protein [Tanacetum cinerariifolium]
MKAKRNSKAPQRFEDSVYSINNSKTNKKTASKKNDGSKKNLEVCENDTEKDMEPNGSKGSYKDLESIGSVGLGRDGCVGNSDVKESSDELSKDMQNDDEGMDSIKMRWNDEFGMDKLEPKCLPVWVKMVNVLLGAWTVEVISALASSLGKPMIMDSNTANMCHKGIGNFDFARVLLEMNADKEFKKPPACDHCKVFGHVTKLCKKGGATFDKVDLKTKENSEEGKEELNNGKHEELRKEMNQEYISNSSIGNNAGKLQGTRSNQSSQWQYNDNERGRTTNNRRQEYRKRQLDTENIRKEGDGNDDQEIRILKGRMIVDEFLNKKMQPNLIESMTWSKDMINYFKEKWESDRQKDINKVIKVLELDDTYTPTNGIGNFMERNEVIGMDRRELWKVLMNDCRVVNGMPWCLAGDMNVIFHPNQHSCRSSIISTDMMEFQDCLNAIEVEDICFIKNFPQAHAKFLSYIISDHSPAILCVPTNVRKHTKSFRFSNYITDKQEFLLIIKEKWDQNITGHKMYQVVKKLKSLKVPLRRLGWSKGNLFQREECLRKHIQDIQTNIDTNPYDQTHRIKEANLLEDFCKAESDEENFLHQQAKIKWLCEGDKNNKFFHIILKRKRNKSKHFEKFLGSSYPVHDIESSETLFLNKLSSKDANSMTVEISDDEIKRALFDIEDSKALSPDGFTSAFFKKA